MDYKVERRPMRSPVLAFKCPKCQDQLRSPIDEANTEQVCPTCRTPFVTPGGAALAAHLCDQERNRFSQTTAPGDGPAALDQVATPVPLGLLRAAFRWFEKTLGPLAELDAMPSFRLASWGSRLPDQIPVLRPLVGVIGALAILLGLASPVLIYPAHGSSSYLDLWRTDTTLLAIVAVLGAANAALRLRAVTVFLGVVGLVAIAARMYFTQQGIKEVRESAKTDLAGNPFAGVASFMLDSARLEWGWVVLFVGAAMLAIAGVLPKVLVPQACDRGCERR